MAKFPKGIVIQSDRNIQNMVVELGNRFLTKTMKF